MSLDGGRILDGVESARQRLGDALRIRRGTYPWLRDYGSLLEELVDRSVDRDFEARVYAAVAGTIAHPPNGLADIALREVRLLQNADAPDRIEIEVFADWLAPDGTGGEFGLRQALAAPRPPAATLYTLLRAGLHTVDVATGAAARVGAAQDYGAAAAIDATSLAWDGRIMWMTTRRPGRLWKLNRSDGTAMPVAGPDNFGVGESAPAASCWASYRLLMLGDDTDALWAIDRATGIAVRVTGIDRFGIGEHQPDGLEWDGWQLWMVGGINHALHRIDPRTGEAVRTGGAHRFGQDLPGGGELAWDGRRLFLMKKEAPGRLYDLDRETGIATPLAELRGAAGSIGGLAWAPKVPA